MHLDVRQPVGYLFLILGIILLVFGAISDPEIYQRHSLGLNINLIWGIWLAIFGAAMLLLVRRARKRKPKPGNHMNRET